MTIREFCDRLIKRNNLSISAFSASLGYKSVNSLYRIMDGNVRNSSLSAFQKKLMSVYQLNSTETELLRDAIYTKQYGNEKKAYYAAIERFLCNRSEHNEKSIPSESSPFQSIYFRYCRKNNLQITILNCLDKEALSPIHDLLEDGAKVTHYLHHRITPLDLLRSLEILMGIMFYPRYTCFAEQADTVDSRILQGKDRSDLMWCSYTGDDHVPHVDLVELSTAGPVFYPDLRVPVPSFADSYQPIKMQWLNAEQLRDYPTFGRKCEELDRNRTTFKIKSDLTYAEISGDHWAPLLRDGPMAAEP